MERKTRTSALVISLSGLLCLLAMIGIQLAVGFYFGKEMENPKLPAITINNTLSLENSLPVWYYAGKDDYRLLFAANTTSGAAKDLSEIRRGIDDPPLMLVMVDPFKRELIQAQKNIFRDNVGDGSNTYLTNGRRYSSMLLDDGLLAYEENQQSLNYCVYYMFKHPANPVLSLSGMQNIAYISQKGIFKKPILTIKTTGGGISGSGLIMQSQQTNEIKANYPIGKLIGWRNGQEIFYSSARLNSKFQYTDMHDLWSMNTYGGTTRKLQENVYSPVLHPYDETVIFLRKQAKGTYSLWTLEQTGKARMLKLFAYSAQDESLPPFDIIGVQGSNDFEVCYAIDMDNGTKSILAANVKTGDVRTLVNQQHIVGPIISSFRADGGLGKYILYFTEENNVRKAYVIDQQGQVQSEVYGLLQLSPSEGT